MQILDEDNIVNKKNVAERHNCTNDEDEIFELQHIPLPGARQGGKEERRVPSSCAICLEPYRPNDSIVWSTNANCVHVFHEQCVSLWLMKRFKPACPVCRQQFISLAPDRLASNETEEALEAVEAVNADETERRLRLLPSMSAETTERNRSNASAESEEGEATNEEEEARDEED